MTEYRDFETDDYRLRFVKDGEDWVCRLPHHVMEMIEVSVTHRNKELTDEEIEEVINRTYWVGTEDEIRMKIARAILRKAQEK